MRFTRLVLLLAAASIAHAATITLAPGEGFNGLLDVSHYFQPPVPDWNYHRVELEIFGAGAAHPAHDSSDAIYIRLSGDDGIYFSGEEQIPGDYSAWVGLFNVPATYHFHAQNVGHNDVKVQLSELTTIANPEPAPWLLMAGGLAALAWRRRRV